jgi:DNA mismatch repair protein MutL
MLQQAQQAFHDDDRAAGRGDSRELLALRGGGHGPPALFSPDQIGAPVPEDIDDAPAAGDRAGTAAPRDSLPQLLTCLPGPVAVFAERDALLAVDLRRLRSHLVYLRLQRDLIGRRVVAVQGLLAPAVVRRPVEEVALIVSARAELLALGVDLDGFGGDAVVVRGVPAHLRHCVDDADVADLIARIVPWLRMRTRESDASAVERGLLGAIAATRGADPAPRLARRWLAELLDAGATLSEVPGLRRWTPAALLGETAGVPRRAIALGHDDGAAL